MEGRSQKGDAVKKLVFILGIAALACANIIPLPPSADTGTAYPNSTPGVITQSTFPPDEERFTATVVFEVVNLRWIANGGVYEQAAYGDRIDVVCHPYNDERPEDTGGWCRVSDPDYDQGLKIWRGCTDRPMHYLCESKWRG